MPLAYSHTHTYTETRKGDYFHDGCYQNDRLVGFRQFWSVKFVSSYQVGGYYQNYCLSIAAIDFATTNTPIYCTLLFFFILDPHTHTKVSAKYWLFWRFLSFWWGPKDREMPATETRQTMNAIKCATSWKIQMPL